MCIDIIIGAETTFLSICVCDFYKHKSPYHIETSPLTYSESQWTCFCMIGPFIIKNLNALVSALIVLLLVDLASHVDVSCK